MFCVVCFVLCLSVCCRVLSLFECVVVVCMLCIASCCIVLCGVVLCASICIALMRSGVV